MSSSARCVHGQRADTYATRLMGALFGLGRAAWVQSVGTLLFNFMTLKAISHAASGAQYNALVWAPNALGSACFLISGALLYVSTPRAGWRSVRRVAGWWEPPVNLLGCVLFGVSAVAGYAITSSGELLDLTTANWTTTFGAACFLAVALAAPIVGMTFKIPRLSRLVALQRALQREVTHARARAWDQCTPRGARRRTERRSGRTDNRASGRQAAARLRAGTRAR